MIKDIINKDKQTNLSPDAVLKDLMEGNERFSNAKMHQRDYASQVEQTKGGQWPQAVVLGCIDSRVPLETIFDQGVGARNHQTIPRSLSLSFTALSDICTLFSGQSSGSGQYSKDQRWVVY